MGDNRKKTDGPSSSNIRESKSVRLSSLLVVAAFCIFVTVAFFVGKEFAEPKEKEVRNVTDGVTSTWRDKVTPVDDEPRDLFAELDNEEIKAKSEENGPWEKYQTDSGDTSKADTAPRFEIESLAESEMSTIDPGYGCSLRSRERYYLMMNSEQSVIKVGGMVLQRELADKLFQEITSGNAQFRSGDYIIRIAKTGSERKLYEGHEFPVSMRVSKGTETAKVSGILSCSA